MAASDYWHCPVCDTKSLYDPSEDEAPDVEVLHAECWTKVQADNERLRAELEQATRMCARPDGVCLQKRWMDGGE